MGNWQVAVGNGVFRSAVAPVTFGIPQEDPLYPLSNFGLGQPDTAARWERIAAPAVYAAVVDLNMLANSSPRADAPTGWADFINAAAGTPGLPANPPVIGSFATRSNVLEFFRPVFQDVPVMPGETVTVSAGLYLPGASTSVAVKLRVLDLSTGKSYDGLTNAWSTLDVRVAQQGVTNTWLDFQETIPADPARLVRGNYRILLEQDSPPHGASTFCYASNGTSLLTNGIPAIYPDVDFGAIIGHNIASGSTVTLGDTLGGPAILTLSPIVFPSMFDTAVAASQIQQWRLTISMPTASADFRERPYIGELWLGTIADMAWCPRFPFDLTLGDSGQVRAPGGYGRQNVFSDAVRARARLKMNFEADDAGYLQARDFLEGATRHGADPLLIMPVDTLEGADAIYHARLNNEVLYSRVNNQRRRYSLIAEEDPFPRI